MADTAVGRFRRSAVGLCALLALTACEGGSLVGRVCQPGEIRVCNCSDETTSRQWCVEDGLRWGVCDCADGTGGCDSIACPAGWVCDPDLLVCVAEPTGDAGVDAGNPTCSDISHMVTRTAEVFLVPPDVGYVHIKAWGSGANGEEGCGSDNLAPNGGPGGFSEATFAVVPDEPLIVLVGRRGNKTMDAATTMQRGFPASGGGGLSGVFRGPDPVAASDRDRALVIAGGGGSGGVNAASDCLPGGAGNHPDAGGESSMQGGTGLDSNVNGGGGGHHGGPGGGRGEHGEGGTGYVSPEALQSITLHSEPGVDARPPRTDDPDYDGVAGTNEMPGLVVLHFTCEEPTL